MAQENGRWGDGKIAGELIKLGLVFSESTIRNVLDRKGIVPAPVRTRSVSWRQLMNPYYAKTPITSDYSSKLHLDEIFA